MSFVDRGIGLRILSGMLFVAMSVCVKTVAEATPVGEIVFFRSFFALLPLIIYLALCRQLPSGLRTANPMGHVYRCLFGCIGMFAGFATLSHLPIAEATMLGYLAPIFIFLFAYLLLDERITAARLLGLGLGSLGVVVLLAPGLRGGGIDENHLLGIGLAVVGAVASAGAATQIRVLTKTETPGAIAFYFALICAIAGLATAPFGWVMPSTTTLLLLIGSGLLGGCAHIAMTLSYRLTEASRLVPFDYLTMVWVVIADVVLFGILPTPSFLLAAPLVIGAAAVVAFADRLPFGRGRGRIASS